jgi:hypothetical protein
MLRTIAELDGSARRGKDGEGRPLSRLARPNRKTRIRSVVLEGVGAMGLQPRIVGAAIGADRYTTGYARDAIVHHGVLDAGVDLLSKPFTTEGLGRELQEILQRAESAF